MKKVAIFICLIIFLVSGCAQKTQQSETGESIKEITIWHPWGGVQKERFDMVVAEFNRTHKNLRVRNVYTPNDNGANSNQKFFTSVAANKPPDLIFVDGPQTAAWAEQGAILPLDKYIAKSDIKAEDYFEPCWKQNYYRGKVWALTFCADPNFGFAWNKRIFREVGLDPERPPRTLEELDEYNEILTKKVGNKIVRMGILPWAQFGNANAVFSWGWTFGGEFYDPETETITCDDEKIIKSIEWMAGYAKKYDMTKVNAFASSFGTKEQNPFYIGQVAMQLLHITTIEEIPRYAPNLDYGVTYIPAPAGGEEHSSWVGGWNIGIPRGSRNPDAAWEFIKWACADPEGTKQVGKIQSLFPGYKKSKYFDEIRGSKNDYAIMLDIMEECRHQRPVMPAQEFYMASLARSLDYVLYGKKTPREALEECRRDVQTELDLKLASDKKEEAKL